MADKAHALIARAVVGALVLIVTALPAFAVAAVCALLGASGVWVALAFALWAITLAFAAMFGGLTSFVHRCAALLADEWKPVRLQRVQMRHAQQP